MGRILYFDPFNGVSGDMILGALLDLGLPLDHLKAEFAKLALEDFELGVSTVKRQGLRGTNLKVHLRRDSQHDLPPRGFEEIRRIVQSSGLEPWIKEKALAIFRCLAQAEAKVHNLPLEKVHFHEIGAVDSMVDIVGACIGFKYFGVNRFFTAAMNLGGGTVTFSHGTWPVPAPATAELVHGFPVFLGKVEGELTTPTGAAIVTTLAEKSTSAPACCFEKTGFGAGDREFPGIPNMLRLILARIVETEEMARSAQVGGWQEDEVILLEASIDDMDAEIFGHFLELSLERGALDVYYVPLHMKKNRPGILLSLLCRQKDQERMAELIFQETTTLGVRWSSWKRWILDREIKEIETVYGPVRVKIGRFQGRVLTISPEYEDLRAIAEKENLPLKVVRQKVVERLPHG